MTNLDKLDVLIQKVIKYGACKRAINDLSSCTTYAQVRARPEIINWVRFAMDADILPKHFLQAYDDAKAPAQQAYDDATAPACQAYDDAKAAARQAYNDAIAAAWQAYDDTIAAAKEAMLDQIQEWIENGATS